MFYQTIDQLQHCKLLKTMKSEYKLIFVRNKDFKIFLINCSIYVMFRCPKNFSPIHRTYDQDSDADLWRETNIFGKRSTRYLCLSKSEGLPEYIVDTLK